MSLSFNLGAAVGIPTNLAITFTLQVLGTAAIWGYTDAAGLRSADEGNIEQDQWAADATLGMSGVGFLYWSNSLIRSGFDDGTINRTRARIQSSESHYAVTNFFLGFSDGLQSPVSTAVAIIKDQAGYTSLPTNSG